MFLAVQLTYAAPVRIMPMGDSITYDDTVADQERPRSKGKRGGYRKHLWYMLQDAGYEADFVGSQHIGADIQPPIDPDNEGHPGWSSYRLADSTYDFLVQNPADIVLLHIGTNDHQSSISGINEVLDMIDLFEQESGISVKVYVALIIDREVPDRNIKYFNENLKELVGRRIKNGDNLTLVDMNGLAKLRSSDYADNTHPNDSGYRKMAQVWFNAIMGPDTPGLYAFPYVLVNKSYIEKNSIIVDYTTNSVQFTTQVPVTGITF